LIATAVAASLAAGVVVAELVWPLDADAAQLRSMIETAITLSALISAVLVGSHLLQGRRLRDLLLMVALTAVSLTDLVFCALPAFKGAQTGAFGVGARQACAMLVTATLVAAAFTPDRRLIGPVRWPASVAVSAGICVVAAGELIDLVAGPGGRGGSAQAYEPLLRTLALVSFCGLLVAGFGFASRAGAEDGEARLLAAASYLLAIASLQAIALPLTPADWVTPEELFKLLACALLLATAARLFVETRERMAQKAVSAERVRIAHDLHDGLAQDLAFIVAYADRLERKLGEGHLLVIAARRALAASRGTIVDLEGSKAPSAVAALREVAAELEARFGVQITVRIETYGDLEPSMTDRRQLVRIAREAISSAVCHGGAQHVAVTLGSQRSDLLLRISDDGCGLGALASEANAGTGLGMRTMRADARTLGGQLVARSRDVGGTEISVVVSDPETKS
jgi:signal transduction histidine kinase